MSPKLPIWKKKEEKKRNIIKIVFLSFKKK